MTQRMLSFVKYIARTGLLQPQPVSWCIVVRSIHVISRYFRDSPVDTENPIPVLAFAGRHNFLPVWRLVSLATAAMRTPVRNVAT